MRPCGSSYKLSLKFASDIYRSEKSLKTIMLRLSSRNEMQFGKNFDIFLASLVSGGYGMADVKKHVQL